MNPDPGEASPDRTDDGTDSEPGSDRHEERRREIEAAAYLVLARKGYKATSMLAIARQANASNQTMYRWYGGKAGLFKALVEANAREVRQTLQASIVNDGDPARTIRRVGPALLRLVTGPKAVMLNRAAVADVAETGTLGATIAASGREAVLPLMVQVFERAHAAGALRCEDAAQAASVYIDLLIGDQQIRRAIGVLDLPDDAAVRARAARAWRLIQRIYGP